MVKKHSKTIYKIIFSSIILFYSHPTLSTDKKIDFNKTVESEKLNSNSQLIKKSPPPEEKKQPTTEELQEMEDNLLEDERLRVFSDMNIAPCLEWLNHPLISKDWKQAIIRIFYRNRRNPQISAYEDIITHIKEKERETKARSEKKQLKIQKQVESDIALALALQNQEIEGNFQTESFIFFPLSQPKKNHYIFSDVIEVPADYMDIVPPFSADHKTHDIQKLGPLNLSKSDTSIPFCQTEKSKNIGIPNNFSVELPTDIWGNILQLLKSEDFRALSLTKKDIYVFSWSPYVNIRPLKILSKNYFQEVVDKCNILNSKELTSFKIGDTNFYHFPHIHINLPDDRSISTNFIKKYLPQFTYLEKLKINYIKNKEVEVEANNFKKTIRFLKKSKNISALTLLNTGVDFSKNSIFETEKIIKKYSCLKKLHFSNNNFGDKSVFIMETLLQNSLLTSLNLSSNKIDQGAGEIAVLLRENKTLKKLNLNHNNIGFEAGIRILSALDINNSLTDLNICNIGLTYMPNILESNHTLKKLCITSNYFDKQSRANIISMIKLNRTLTSLSISNSNFDQEDINNLALSLKSNTILTELYFGYILDTELNDNGLKEIGKALGVNKGLKVLYLAGKSFLNEDMSDIFANGLQMNTFLKSLTISFQNISINAKDLIKGICDKKSIDYNKVKIKI